MLDRYDMTPRVARQMRVVPVPAACKETADPLDEFLGGRGQTVTFRRGQEVFAQESPAESCYRLVTGAVRTVVLLEDGRRQVTEFLLAGDLLGFDAAGTHDVSAEAVTDSVLRRYRRREIEALANDHGALARYLRHLAARRIREARGHILLLGRTTATERVASFLLEIGRRAQPGPAGHIAVPMTRTDIADHLGLTLETVCRVFSQLRREGAIEVGRGEVVVRDRRLLEALGGWVPGH